MENNNMKEKLVELLKKARGECHGLKQCESCVGYGKGEDCVIHLIADTLLDNGVIVLPFPIGTTYYRIVTKRGKVGNPYFKMIRKAELNWYNVENVLHDLGKTVFLTREEAENALEIDGVMEAAYTVTTKNGKVYKWSFTESKSEGDYGNGIYIAVKSPSGDVFSYDCRYMRGYEFHKACVDYLLAYYGENLDALSEDD